MRLNKIFIVILLSASQILAQDIGTTEINVVEGFKPTIPQATRLNKKAAFTDTIKKDRTQEYTVVVTDLKSDYKIRPLKAAKVKDDKIPKLYQSIISLGTGYRVSSNISAIYNSDRSKDISYGLIFNHFNNNVRIDKKLAGRSNNNLHLYIKKIKKEYAYIANLDYERIGSFTYGIKTLDKAYDILLLDNNLYYNRFAYTKLSTSYINIDKTSNRIIRNTTFFISDLNECSENQIHLSADLSKEINGLPVNVEIELNDYLNYNNSNSKFKNTSVQSFHFSPSTSLSKYGFDFNLGMEFHYLSDENLLEIFPQIKVTKQFVEDVLLVYGGLRHVEQRHTLKSLSDENPYIHSYGTNQTILAGSAILQKFKTTDTEELYIAIRNVLAVDEVFRGSIAYGKVQDFAHFVALKNENYNRFKLDYLDVSQLHINVNYDRKINAIVSLNVNADYYKWDNIVYHKPNFVFTVSAPVNLRNKIKVSPSLTYSGERESISYSFSELGFLSQTPMFKDLLPQLHVNLGLYYLYSKQLSAYFKLNNLTNSKQDIWSGYKEVGFNGLFGVSYSF